MSASINYGPEVANAMSVLGMPIKGNVFFVDPKSGSDGNTGTDPKNAVKTVSAAYNKTVAGNGDVVFFLSYDNTGSNTTDYLSSTLTWANDNTHLIGIGAPVGISPRARIAQLSTATSVLPLVTISADNCVFANIQFYQGAADAGSDGCVNITGQRNYFENVHFAGIGDATQDTAGSYSLALTGGSENRFVKCTIGLDTVARGTAQNAELYLRSAATRNVFEDCLFLTFAEAATHLFVDVNAVGALDRFVLFKNCTFINPISSTSTGLTVAVATKADQGGLILMQDCTIVGATDVAGTDVGLYLSGAAPTNNTSGLAVLVETT